MPDAALSFSAVATAQATYPGDTDFTDVKTNCPGPTEGEFVPLPNNEALPSEPSA